MQQASVTILYHIEILEIQESHAHVNGNLDRDSEIQRSKIVFNAQYDFNIKDQAKHFVRVEACYKAFPRRSSSRQSNDSAVDSSCTSMAFMM